MADSEIDYPKLLQRALRSVVGEVLARTAREGLPGEHHFYLSLRTDHPRTQLPAALRQRFPEEITVVLQHQFDDLVVDEEGFAVTLRFDGAPARLVVPWEAVVAFFDPAAEFGLRFDLPGLTGPVPTPGAAAAPPAEQPRAAKPETAADDDAAADGAKVLSFGRPRERRGD
jgi:hypothetical protein